MRELIFLFDRERRKGRESRIGGISNYVGRQLGRSGVVQGELKTLRHEDGGAFVDGLGLSAGGHLPLPLDHIEEDLQAFERRRNGPRSRLKLGVREELGMLED